MLFRSQFGTNYNLAFASYLLALIPILIFYIFCQKQIIGGIANGAVKGWKNDYAFQQDIIIEACQRASADNKINFRYINGILTSWHESQVKDLEDIRRLDQQHAAQKKNSGRSAGHKTPTLSFHDFDQREYDNQELENFFIKEVQKMTE